MENSKRAATERKPSNRFKGELTAASNFLALCRVILDGTDESKVFFLLLDRYESEPDGLTCTAIVKELGLTQAVVSNALRKLTNKYVIDKQRVGQCVYNTLRPGVQDAIVKFNADKLAF